MSKHSESQRMVEALQVGDRVDVRSGAGKVTLIDLGPIQPADEGSYAGVFVLHTTGDEFMPYATHMLYYQDDSKLNNGWQMTGGQSYRNLVQAVEEFPSARRDA